jgi:hypothetical protein
VTELLGSPHPGRDLVWLADQLIALVQYSGSLTLEVRHTEGGARELVCRPAGEPRETVLPGRGPLYVFRPLLARIAMVGADETATEFQPYGGAFTLYRSGRSGRVRLDVAYSNTPAKQSLDIRRTETADHRGGTTRPSGASGHLDPIA